jgi:hypothetical protein
MHPLNLYLEQIERNKFVEIKIPLCSRGVATHRSIVLGLRNQFGSQLKETFFSRGGRAWIRYSLE